MQMPPLWQALSLEKHLPRLVAAVEPLEIPGIAPHGLIHAQHTIRNPAQSMAWKYVNCMKSAHPDIIVSYNSHLDPRVCPEPSTSCPSRST